MGRFGELMAGPQDAVPPRDPTWSARIAFRELNYARGARRRAARSRGRACAISTVERRRGFEAEPFDLVAEMPKFSWPTVVISGGRDLITPPAVAERIAGADSRSGAGADCRPPVTACSTPASGPRCGSPKRPSSPAGSTPWLPQADDTGRDAESACGAADGVGDVGGGRASRRALPERCCASSRVRCPTARSLLLHETDRGVVQVAESGRAEVGQVLRTATLPG